MQVCTEPRGYRCWKAFRNLRREGIQRDSVSWGCGSAWACAVRTRSNSPSLLRWRFARLSRSSSVGVPSQGFQGFHFTRCQVTEVTRFNTQVQWPIADTFDLLHAMADLLKHSANLPIAALD